MKAKHAIRCHWELKMPTPPTMEDVLSFITSDIVEREDMSDILRVLFKRPMGTWQDLRHLDVRGLATTRCATFSPENAEKATGGLKLCWLPAPEDNTNKGRYRSILFHYEDDNTFWSTLAVFNVSALMKQHMSFEINPGSPNGKPAWDANDETLSEATETAFDMNEDDAVLTWNGVHFSLGYKYDISLMMDDLLMLLGDIQQHPTGQKEVHWVSSGFPFTWNVRWNPASIQIDAHSRDETLAIDLKGRESITTDRQRFLDSWKPILAIVYSRLRSAGYSAAQLRNFRILQSMAVGGEAEA